MGFLMMGLQNQIQRLCRSRAAFALQHRTDIRCTPACCGASRKGETDKECRKLCRYRFLRVCLLVTAYLFQTSDIRVANGQDSGLPRSTPEAQGVSSGQILEFIEAVDQQVDSIHSFMLVRHGHVVVEAWWEPESAEKPHVLWSLSKSFTSTAVGLAVSEGRLSIDDPVLKFFPDSAPQDASANLRAMRVRDLLTMSTGHQDQPQFDPDRTWVQAFLAHPVPHKPGTHFQYNTPATYMLSAIVQKVTGETLVDYLKPRLFAPLEIADPQWDRSPQGISIGGYGLFLKTEDIAKFGQLYLQGGIWRDQTLLPRAWIEQATSKQVSNGSNPDSDWEQGYGFQFWRCRHGAFRGDGKSGQFCVVLPDQDGVVVMTANARDMRGQLGIVWEKLLPAFQASALPANPDAEARLQARIGTLKATR